MDTVTEKLASCDHEAWSGWMKYMFEKSTSNSDGSVTIPASLVDRWTRQMNTPYEMLPDNEQQSDIVEAEKMLEIMSGDSGESIVLDGATCPEHGEPVSNLTYFACGCFVTRPAVFTIKTDDEVAGLDITNALSVAGIKHTIVSKQNNNAAQHSAHPTLLPARRKLVSCPRCKLMFGVALPVSQSG